MYPTAEQEHLLRVHVGQARFVWNLALEQCGMAKQFGQYADQSAWDRQLAEVRKSVDWLGDGSSAVQQAALRDLRQAFRNWWSNPTHFGHPKFRKHGVSEGFTIRDLRVRKLSRKWASVLVPKVGHIKFRLTRPVPLEAKSARVTLDRSGRWHVSIVAVPARVEGPADGTIIGVDRGVAIPFQASDGRSWDVPGLTVSEARRLKQKQREIARRHKGSKRCERSKVCVAKLRAKEADRRKYTIEKITTELALTAHIVRIEDLKVSNMMRSAKGTLESPGTNVAQKRGLNRAIARIGWAMFARRLQDKMGDRLERVPAAFTSQRCHKCGHVERGNRAGQAQFVCLKCGHTANADLNAALNIRDSTPKTAAGFAVDGRGGTGAIGPPVEASTTSKLELQHA